MNPTTRLFSSLIAIMVSSAMVSASPNDCVGDKCFASFQKSSSAKEANNASALEKTNAGFIMTAYQQTVQQKDLQPFQHIQMVNDFITTDVPQNRIVLDEEPLLIALEYVESIAINQAPMVEDVVPEESDVDDVIMENEEPLLPEYACDNEQEVLICDADIDECICA